MSDIAAKTHRKQEYKANEFEKFVVENGFAPDIPTMYTDIPSIDLALIEYFRQCWQQKNHSKSSLTISRSLLKASLLRRSQTSVNIGYVQDFPNFDKFWKEDLIPNVQESNHLPIANEPLSAACLIEVFKQLKNLSELMEYSDKEDFVAKLNLIPMDWRKKFNNFVQFGIFFLFHYLLKMDKNGYMNEMTKDLLYITEENNLKYYKLKDIEGQIPFVINPVGFNPGLYIHRYVQKLSPDTSDIFPLPLRFHEFRPSDPVWFRGVRIGKNRPDEAMKIFGLILGKERLSKTHIRATLETFSDDPFLLHYPIDQIVEEPYEEPEIKDEPEYIETIKDEPIQDDHDEFYAIEEESSEMKSVEDYQYENETLKLKIQSLEQELSMKNDVIAKLKRNQEEQSRLFASLKKCQKEANSLFDLD